MIPASFPGLFAFALLALCIPPAGATPKPELQELRGRIEKLQKDLDTKEDARADASDALKTSERAISDLNLSLRELSTRQREAGVTLTSLEQRKADTAKRIAEEQALFARLLYQQYLSGQQDQFKILLNHEDPNLSARQLRYYAYLARARNELLDNLRTNLDQLQQLSRAAETKQDELARIRKEQDQQKQALLGQQQAKKKLVAQLAQQIGQQRSELSQLQRNEKRLTQLIERLAKLPPPPRKERPAPSTGTTTPAPEASEPSPQGGGAFAQQKGKLRLPVRGELAGRFGTPRQDSGAPWRGVFIRAAAGRDVRSVANGRVVFSDWLRGFGNLIIVDHGNSYMSLYGNNEALFKQAGENIQGGEVIASTGNSGGNPETGLYFELRYQGRPFDPLSWCKTG